MHLSRITRVLAPIVLLILAGCAGTESPSSSTSSSAPVTGTTVCDGQPKSTLTLSDASHTVVAIKTSLGCLAVELYDDKAPITTANFLTYVNEGFYTNLHFYRIITGFVNQGGGERDGQEGTHPAIKNEAKASGLHNGIYTVAMARLGPECQGCPDKPDSATTEFYINQADNGFLDPGGSSEAGYAVFGILVAGRDISDQMNKNPKAPAPVLESIKVVS